MELLLEILKAGLWGSPLKASSDSNELKKVLDNAEKQTVSALVFNALDENQIPLPREIVLRQMGLLQQIKSANAKVNVVANSLGLLLKKESIKYVIVKGQAVGACYPHPELRQSGDIDFYCIPEYFQKAKNTISKCWQIVINDSESDHHVDFMHGGVPLELHYSLTLFYNESRDAYWNTLLKETPIVEVNAKGLNVSTLHPTVHSLYIFFHLYHHLLELGVGLRQFCDWAVILHACNHDIDHEAIKKHLKILGMEKAYRACGAVLVDYLGLPETEFTYTLSKSDRRYAKKILDIVFYRGNMGKYNKKSGFNGWRHKVESMGIKTSHFMKFWSLAPKYSCNWFWHEFWRKI